jgi:hypothetical protein
MINWRHIIEGWANHLIPPEEIKEFISLTSQERISICETCPHHSSNKENYKTIRMDKHCTICGCPLKALTKCLSCTCSLEELKQTPLWFPVLTPKEEEQFNIECDEEEENVN